MATYSIIIRNGLVFDGNGNLPQINDIGITDDKIKKIGDLSGDKAPAVIDAANKYVCPGFIDLTTHSDTHWTIFSQPSQESFIRQGVTTIIGGHGGSSLAPLVKAENIETIQKWIDVSKINVNWQSMEEFLAELDRHPLGVNFGTLAGYGTIRRGIIGDEIRSAKVNEIDQMQYLAEKSLKEGAFGFSANFGAAHQKPASDEEIIAILNKVKTAKKIASYHLEDEGKDILPSIAHLISLARNSGVSSHIAHFKAIGKTSWGFFSRGLEMIEEAQKEGLAITCDFFPYTRTGSNLYSLLPDWARESGKEHILELIRGKERKHLIDSLKDFTLHYDKIDVASTRHDLDGIGKSIQALAQSSDRSPEDVILDLLDVNDLQVAIFNEAILEKNIELLAGKKYSMVASDGVGYSLDYRAKTDLPHPRSFGSFPRVFAELVREKEILNWEEAIYKMTGFPAKTLGISGRGIIEKDAYADIVVFDPKTIADRADYINPFRPPDGIEHVLINGAIALEKNALVAANKGRILRST